MKSKEIFLSTRGKKSMHPDTFKSDMYNVIYMLKVLYHGQPKTHDKDGIRLPYIAEMIVS